MITTDSIIQRYAIGSKLPQIMDEMGWEMLKTGVTVETSGDLPGDTLLETVDDLEQFIFSITKAEVKHVCVNDSETDNKTYFIFRLDLWAHAGYPGGSSNKYIGRITLSIEESGFLLIAAKYL